MKLAIPAVLSLIAFVLLLAPCSALAAGACFACASPIDKAELQQLCPSSQILHDAFMACVRRDEGDPAGGCANECASWLTAYDACMSGNDPLCSPADLNHDGVLDATDNADSCYHCWSGYPSAPYAGSGCAASDDACIADTTECISCADFEGGMSADLVCNPSPSLDAASTFNTCACYGSCAKPCATSCPAFLGYKVLDTATETAKCSACLSSPAKCGPARNTCLAL